MNDTAYLQQLKSCELFRELGEEELQALYACMVQVNVKAGHVLVTEGEASNSMHILLSGRLLVQTSGGKVIGQISRGQTVGEMGLITNEPRSATVIAMRNSLLLELDSEHFSQLWEKHPSVLLTIAKTITRRLQKTIKSSQNYSNASNIVIFSGHQHVNMPLFVEQLSASFDKKFHYKILSRSDFLPTAPSMTWHETVRGYEGNYDYLFYVVGEDHEWQEFCLERADHIYVVVNADKQPVFDPKVIKALSSDDLQSHFKKVLVLLHEVWAPPTNTADWLRDIQFTQHHHLCIHQKDDFSRLLRFVNGSAIGLVLSGGGTRAWAQVGVIKSLLEQKIPIDALAGTSAGSVSAAVLAISRDYQDFLEASQTISRLTKFNEYSIPVVSVLSSTSLIGALKKIFGTIKIEDLNRMLFCITADLVSSSEVDINRGLLWRAIRASSAVPGIYPPVYGDGKMLVDGAVVNNLPIDVMRNYFDDSGKIIAVNIAAARTSPVEYNYPLDLDWRWLLRHKFFTRHNKVKLPPIGETVLKGLMLSSIQKIHVNKKMSDIYIEPPLQGHRFLDVSKRQELLDLGYATAQAALGNWREVLDYQGA